MAQPSGSFTRTNSGKRSWAEDADESDGGLEDYMAKNTDFYQNGKLRLEKTTLEIEQQDEATSFVIEPDSQEEAENNVVPELDLEQTHIPELMDDHKLEIAPAGTIVDRMTSMTESVDDNSLLEYQNEPDECHEKEQKANDEDCPSATSIQEVELSSPCTVPTVHVEMLQGNHEDTPPERIGGSINSCPANSSIGEDEYQSSQDSIQDNMQNSLVSPSTPFPTPPASLSTFRIGTHEKIPDDEIEKISDIMSEAVSEPMSGPELPLESLAQVLAEPVLSIGATSEVEIAELEEQSPASFTSPEEENKEPINAEAATEGWTITEEVKSPSVQETEPAKNSSSQVVLQSPDASVSLEGLVEPYPEFVKVETTGHSTLEEEATSLSSQETEAATNSGSQVDPQFSILPEELMDASPEVAKGEISEDKVITEKVILPPILETEPPKTTWSHVAKIGDQQARELEKLERERNLEEQKKLEEKRQEQQRNLEKQKSLQIRAELEIQNIDESMLIAENKLKEMEENFLVENRPGSSRSEESDAEVQEKEPAIRELNFPELGNDPETASVSLVDSEESTESQPTMQPPISLEEANEPNMEDSETALIRTTRASGSISISSEGPSAQDLEPTVEYLPRNKRNMTKEARQRKRETDKEKKKEEARILNESSGLETETTEVNPTADEEEVESLSTGLVEQTENKDPVSNTLEESTVQIPEPEVKTTKAKKRKMTKEAKQRKRKNDNEKKKTKASLLEDSAGPEAAKMEATPATLESPKATKKKICYWILGFIILAVIIVLGFLKYPHDGNKPISKVWATIDLDAIDWATMSPEALRTLPSLEDKKAIERATEEFQQSALSGADITPERFFRLYQQFFIEHEIEREGNLIEL